MGSTYAHGSMANFLTKIESPRRARASVNYTILSPYRLHPCFVTYANSDGKFASSQRLAQLNTKNKTSKRADSLAQIRCDGYGCSLKPVRNPRPFGTQPFGCAVRVTMLEYGPWNEQCIGEPYVHSR